MQYQVTLVSTSGKYRPVSAIVITEDSKEKYDLLNKDDRKKLVNRGVQKICLARNWGSAELKKYNYTQSKIRVYDKAKIKAEEKARYNRIKEEKYASGEWKRPKEK